MEDATDLALGDDFAQEGVVMLSLGEAKALLDNVLKPEDQQAKTERDALPENPCVF